jgi:hypothetical protein
MTTIKPRLKAVYHESPAVEDGRAVCVAETPAGMLLRLKGTRQSVLMPWGLAYQTAARIEAENQRRVAGTHRVQRSFSRGSL